jgi:hypothetical protein
VCDYSKILTHPLPNDATRAASSQILALALSQFLKQNQRHLRAPGGFARQSFIRSLVALLGKGAPVRKPSLGAILFALIPFTTICFSVPLWDRIYPMVFGVPFNFFWLISWLLLTPACLCGAYRAESKLASELQRHDGGKQ